MSKYYCEPVVVYIKLKSPIPLHEIQPQTMTGLFPNFSWHYISVICWAIVILSHYFGFIADKLQVAKCCS